MIDERVGDESDTENQKQQPHGEGAVAGEAAHQPPLNAFCGNGPGCSGSWGSPWARVRRLSVTAFFEGRDGAITQWREYWDTAHVAQQLGIDPALMFAPLTS